MHLGYISNVKKDLGMFICKHTLFQHAFLGCSITSRLFGIGKGAILKKFKANSSLEIAIVAIYNGEKDYTLNGL